MIKMGYEYQQKSRRKTAESLLHLRGKLLTRNIKITDLLSIIGIIYLTCQHGQRRSLSLQSIARNSQNRVGNDFHRVAICTP